MTTTIQFQPGNLVRVRGREWVVLPGSKGDLLRLRPLGGSEDEETLIYVPLEPVPPAGAEFGLPTPQHPGSQEEVLLLYDAMRLKVRSGAGPFRSFGNITVEPRAYQLVPLLMALKLDPIRLLIADDVGIGKTIEAGLIARELLDRGEITRMCVMCPPHLCEQWRLELESKFNIQADIVSAGTASRLERDLRPDESIFEVHPFTIVSLDYIKSEKRRDDFLRTCPEFVIVDEAHTCVQANTSSRHQRYQLLSKLARVEPKRHMMFLTATPHSGDDTAFYNLLGLLDPKFVQLAEMEDGPQRQRLREELAHHFVQRRRGDIDEWRDSVGFPRRESGESTYKLTGEWGNFFFDTLRYAQSLVRRTEGGTVLEKRMSWWAALALLRCVSSSPKAADIALETRLRAVSGLPEEEQTKQLDEIAAHTVLDGIEDLVSLDESTPAGAVDSPEDFMPLKQLIDRVRSLQGPEKDPKLAALIRQVKQLIQEGFRPVVFCRYIATAKYVQEYLSKELPEKTEVLAITGELTPEEREARIEDLANLEDDVTPVLVATDCLSEGINLQRFFDAVIHYDLSWNPMRHEQREGRVDRFGQTKPVVRTMMLYGEDNPVDGAVLRVILRKAERIRKELGVWVPLPTDNEKVIETIMKTVLLRSENEVENDTQQLALNLFDQEQQVEVAWESAKEKINRTVFAQRGLRPQEVWPEWEKTQETLGIGFDVERFVRKAAERLKAPLDPKRDGSWVLPLRYLPRTLRERLETFGWTNELRIGFREPVGPGVEYIHRTHPLVFVMADFLAEQALDQDDPEFGARCGALFTKDVLMRTVVFLIRMRNQVITERRVSGKTIDTRVSIAEECLCVSVKGTEEPKILSSAEVHQLLSASPARNMERPQQIHVIQAALNMIPGLEPALRDIAERRAQELLADHRRVREATATRRDTGVVSRLHYNVQPLWPVDVIGVYVLVPTVF